MRNFTSMHYATRDAKNIKPVETVNLTAKQSKILLGSLKEFNLSNLPKWSNCTGCIKLYRFDLEISTK